MPPSYDAGGFRSSLYYARLSRTIQREDPGALLVGSDAIFTSGRQRIVELATQLRIPSMYGWREFVEVGGSCLMERAFPICIGVPPPMWTRSSKAPSPLTFPSSSQPSSNW